MKLIIRALTLDNRPLSQALTGVFGAEGGTIGRSDTNTIALPDPERHISRLQAEVIAEAGCYRVRNAAAVNPILLNGRPLGPGESAPLADGDELQIGGYVLGVQFGDSAAADARAPANAHTVITASAHEQRTHPPAMVAARMAARTSTPSAPPAANPFADLLAPIAAASPHLAHADPSMPMAPTGATASQPRAPIAASGPSAGNPFADLLAPQPSGAVDPFADLLAPAAAPSHSVATDPFAFLEAGSHVPAAGAPEAAALPLPDDFDPFADIAAPLPPAIAPTFGSPGLLGSIGAATGHEPGIDEAFGLAPVSGADDPLGAFIRAPSGAAMPGGAALAGGELSTDPLALFGAPQYPGVPDIDRPAAPDHTAELAGAYTPPRVLPGTPPIDSQTSGARGTPAIDVEADLPLGMPLHHQTALASAAPATGASGAFPTRSASAAAPAAPASMTPPASPADRHSTAAPPAAESLWAAFCDGAGIALAVPQGPTAAQMHMVGQLLREAIDGTLRLMSVRATTKQELRAQVTTIRSRNNNPLKFAPDAQLATEQLLQPPLRGFMAGPAAMQDAMHDLVGHGIGTMVGMRAALAGVLERFEPQQLETRLAARGVIDSLLPMNRKARLWDLYLQHFEAIRSDAQDDFDTLFGKAFVAAYEEQLDRLPQKKVG